MIRPATPADADALLALESSVPPAAHWSPAEYAHILGSQNEEAPLRRLIFIAQEHETLLGFIVVRLLHIGETSEAGIESLAVSPAARRRGIGSALCTAALEACRAANARAVELEVRAGNHAAIALYTKLGFTQTGLRPAYYANPPEDAVLLRFML
jgi:ribosomal-protein-alanine N-acetyltransferase